MKPGFALFRRLGYEGPVSIRDRLWDRWRERRRWLALREIPGGLGALPSWARSDVLQLSAVGPLAWWGGVQAQQLDRLRAQHPIAPVALLHGRGPRLWLEVAIPGREGLRTELAATPPEPLALRDEAFEQVVGEAISALGAEVLHVETAHQLPLSSLVTLASGGTKMILSIHDFALFCPRPNLLEVTEGRFCRYCADFERCGRCLRADSNVDDEYQRRRRSVGEELLAACACVVYPSSFLRDAHHRLFGASPRAEAIIPPAASVMAGSARRRVSSRDRPPVIAFLGGGSIHKGSAVFRDVLREWERRGLRPVRWRIYGGFGEMLAELRRLPGVEVRGYYRHGSVAMLLSRDGVDLALLLSVVPESYSLALDECAVAGVPAISFGLGAIGERLARTGGMLVDPSAGAAGVVDAIERWLDSPLRIRGYDGIEVASPAAAARRWQELYTEVARHRKDDEPGSAWGEGGFHYPPARGDRLKEAAGRVEWATRGAARWVGREAAPRLVELARRDPVTAGRGDAAPRRGAPIVYMPALSWSFRFQRPQQLARALGSAGHEVLYCEAFRRTRILPKRLLQPPIGRVHPLQLSIPGRLDPYREPPSVAVAHELAERIAAGLATRPELVLAQLPFWGPVAHRLSRILHVPLLYDRLDFHLGFPGVPSAMGELERELIAACDLVLASSEVLLESAVGAAKVALVPNAVALEDFPERRHIPNAPVRVGYVGALGEWFDAEGVRRLAARRPDWRFALAGRVEEPSVRALGHLDNVELLGEIPYGSLPSFLASLHVLLIPFLDLPLTRAVDPVKLYEALAAGLPVVARRLPAMERWRDPLVYTYTDGPTEGLIELALAEDGPEVAVRRRQAVAAETWQARAAQVLEAVAALG